MNRKYRRAIIAGNWKMNMLASDVRHYAAELKSLVPNPKWCDTIICAPYTALPAAARAFKGCRVAVGAQNINENRQGAFTGEISGSQLTDLGAEYVIVGHSERRALYGESDITVGKKLSAALDAPLRPILCVGESLQQRELGVAFDIVTLQTKLALTGVPAEKMRKIIIAYEPVWAIGTGKTASPDDAQAVCAELRAVVRKLYGARVARAVSILYGGSITEKNAGELFARPDIDGGLVGGASLDPKPFAAIIDAAKQP